MSMRDVYYSNSCLRKMVRERMPEDYLAKRAEFAARIHQFAEDGFVAVVYGGMDCDCARWDDRVVILPAIPTVVVHWIDQYNEGAEGPQWTNLERPSIANELTPSSRDLALEAFEDGHPHSIHL
jgi:hypothetical protein